MGNILKKVVLAAAVTALSAQMISQSVIMRTYAFGESYRLAIDTSSRPFIWPVPSSNRISTCFTCGRAHNAIDISAPIGEDILAACDGVVEEARTGCTHFAVETPCDCNGSTGNCVILRHDINGVSYWTVYMHMNDVYVEDGQVVKQGDVIGTVGSTGRAYGSHLDFSIRLDYAWSQNKLDPGYNTVLPEELIRYSSNDCCVDYLTDITHRSYKMSEAPVLSADIGCSSTPSFFTWGMSLSAEKYCLKITDQDGNDHSVNDISKDDFRLKHMLPVGKYKACLETYYPEGSKITSNTLEFEIGEAPALVCETDENSTHLSWSEVSDAASYRVHVNRYYRSDWDPEYDYEYSFFSFEKNDGTSADLVLPRGEYRVTVDAVIDENTSRKSNFSEVVIQQSPVLKMECSNIKDNTFTFSWPGCDYPGKYDLIINNGNSWMWDDDYKDYSVRGLTENSTAVNLEPGDYSAVVRYITGEYDYYSSDYVYFSVDEPDPAGDANGDGVISDADALILKSYLLTVDRDFPEVDFENADVNGNGEIDLFDMIRLRKRMLEEM